MFWCFSVLRNDVRERCCAANHHSAQAVSCCHAATTCRYGTSSRHGLASHPAMASTRAAMIMSLVVCATTVGRGLSSQFARPDSGQSHNLFPDIVWMIDCWGSLSFRRDGVLAAEGMLAEGTYLSFSSVRLTTVRMLQMTPCGAIPLSALALSRVEHASTSFQQGSYIHTIFDRSCYLHTASLAAACT